MKQEKIRNECLNRLSRIEGQVRGISGMIKKDRSCADVLMQLSAVKSAVQKLSECIMRKHLDSCVKEVFNSGDEEGRDEKIQELIDFYSRISKGS